MRNKTALIPLFCLSILFGLSSPSQAEEQDAWWVGAKLKEFFSSHTSYEFGDPTPGGLAPLSRLEFPMARWWGGVEVGRQTARWSVHLEALTNLSSGTHDKMKDSDWDALDSVSTLTTYSESHCRVKPSYLVEGDFALQVGDWLGLPREMSLAPVVGLRYQYFDFVTHDGWQWALEEDGVSVIDPLPGDGIAFKQTYWHYFLGLRAGWELTPPSWLARLGLSIQADWAYVTGENEDLHLLRKGTRLTTEDTTGEAWHLALGLDAALTPNWLLCLQADYLSVYTTGTHRLQDSFHNLDLSWDKGVTVWSEQISATLTLVYRF